MVEHPRADQAEDRQEEREDRVPERAGIVHRRLKEVLFLFRMDDLFVLLLVRSIGVKNGDRLERLVLFADGLILLDFLLVRIHEVVMADVHELGLVLAVIVDRGIVGEEHLVLLQLRIGDGDGGDQ